MSHVAFLNAIFDFYDELCDDPLGYDFTWTDARKKFSLKQANSFFIGVLLDQGQDADRAWEGGKHIVENYFCGDIGFWQSITKTSDDEIAKICTKGFDGKTYARNFQTNKFPLWLKSAAIKMLEKYDGDPRKIWNVSPKSVCVIYERFVEFDGIGDALAKMAQFILVRNYGVAGGKENQPLMSVKPDILVRRVLSRAGIARSESLRDTMSALETLSLERPVDFDASTWSIGRDYCYKTDPNCIECPLKKVCSTAKSLPTINGRRVAR